MLILVMFNMGLQENYGRKVNKSYAAPTELNKLQVG